MGRARQATPGVVTPSNPAWEAAKAARRTPVHHEAVQETASLERQYRRLWSSKVRPSPVDLNEVLQTLTRKKVPFVLSGAHGLGGWTGRPRATPLHTASCFEPSGSSVSGKESCGRRPPEPTIADATRGCRLNAVDSRQLQGRLEDRGFRTVPFGTRADVVVVNTCTVTARAELSDRQAIRIGCVRPGRPSTASSGQLFQPVPGPCAVARPHRP